MRNKKCKRTAKGKPLAIDKELQKVCGCLYDLKKRLMSSQRSIETSSNNIRAQESEFYQQLKFTEKNTIDSY